MLTSSLSPPIWLPPPTRHCSRHSMSSASACFAVSDVCSGERQVTVQTQLSSTIVPAVQYPTSPSPLPLVIVVLHHLLFQRKRLSYSTYRLIPVNILVPFCRSPYLHTANFPLTPMPKTHDSSSSLPRLYSTIYSTITRIPTSMPNTFLPNSPFLFSAAPFFSLLDLDVELASALPHPPTYYLQPTTKKLA